MQHDYRDVTGGNLERGEISGSIGRDSEVRSTVAATRPTSEWPCLHVSRAHTLSQSEGEIPRRGTSNTFTQQLGVATSRALERRLGIPPSQADVSKVVNVLTSRSSRFLQYAERTQAELARLHSELQKSQEQQSHTDIAQEITVSYIGSGKRPLEESDHKYPPREAKRARLESGNPNPQKSPPPKNTTQTSTQETLGMAPPPPTATSTSEAQQTVLSTQPQDVIGSRTNLSLNSPALAAVAVAEDHPACTRQQAPPPAPAPPFIASVPGIWAIQVGKPLICQTDLSFEVDQDTVGCIRRWATRGRQGFDPDVRHVVVYLVALHATAVSAAQRALSQNSGSITPQAFALALHDLQPQWPDDGALMLQLNVDQPGERSWFASDMSAGKPLDVSGAILAGTNSLRILQLRNMAELVFALYATPPTAEMVTATMELERQRKKYSFRRPHTVRLLG
ncbi:hypothetical protein EDB92DRAFT_2107087 [Lactarius akahatsu]|uniref:Uncharacterized protein n=1 Tax=Lactarius akahatsu TaxID=416441 RepID=A0AAD4Q8J3_9AGAM|nr:hypothetical protein EDB92DRAFT_2107087 [Lactarius akahatsu]